MKNFLVEGISGTGKTAVCAELQRRGHHAIHGDRELAYQGDPITGAPTSTSDHEHHIWDVAAVRRLLADGSTPVTFLCGGSRNHAAFVDDLDGAFVLTVDAETLVRRLDGRPRDEWGTHLRNESWSSVCTRRRRTSRPGGSRSTPACRWRRSSTPS